MFKQPALDLLSTAIVILNPQCELVFVNLAATQLLGINQRQSMGQSLFNLIEADFDQPMLVQMSQQQARTYIQDAHITTLSGRLISNVLVSSFVQAEQSYLLLELQSSELHSHIIKDLELQQQTRVSDHLVLNLAHEIKNPLGGIKGAAQLLQRKLPTAELAINSTALGSNRSFDTYCQIIIQESERLSELVDRLLLPAKVEPKAQVNPHLILEKALEIIQLQQPQSVKVFKDYDPSLPEIFVSPGQIQQSLLNLLKNAVEAIEPAGQITLKTRVLHQHSIANRQYKQVVKIDVIDDGGGVPEALIKDIFFPTISGKNSSGLGLSIAQSLVQRHGGIIELENLSGQTCFSVYLPLIQPSVDE